MTAATIASTLRRSLRTSSTPFAAWLSGLMAAATGAARKQITALASHPFHALVGMIL
jgi:hypothetical protein